MLALALSVGNLPRPIHETLWAMSGTEANAVTDALAQHVITFWRRKPGGGIVINVSCWMGKKEHHNNMQSTN